jgi:type I restriction enzyme M protein
MMDKMSDGAESLSGHIWSVADLLRGEYKQAEYGTVILPMTVLRRLDCVLEPTREAVLVCYRQLVGAGNRDMDALLRDTAGLSIYNISELNFQALIADPLHIAQNLRSYILGFSAAAADVLDRYGFDAQIDRLDEAGLLYPLVSRFTEIDLGSKDVSNRHMGLIFEALIARFSERSSDTAGEHFTPRDVITLMARLLLASHSAVSSAGVVRTVYDPVCGTGGMLNGMRELIEQLDPDVTVSVYGQELNAQTYAICRSDIILKGGNPENVTLGNTLSRDAYRGETFDYILADPPFGVSWKPVERFVRAEAALGFSARFGAGLPRINDSSLLFLQHMISKMKPAEEGGSRLAVVFNGSPLFAGMAGSGESEIRRWILENDLLEGVIALPDGLFYRTGIATYIWVLTNRKATDRQGMVALVNGRDEWQKLRGSRQGKRKYVGPEQVEAIIGMYENATAIVSDPQNALHARVRVLRNEEFAYQTVVVEQPLRVHFELSAESLSRLSDSSVFRKIADPDGLSSALRPLIGSLWPTRSKMLEALSAAARAGVQVWPAQKSFENSVCRVLAVRDAGGEVQQIGGSAEADRERRKLARLPLHEHPDDYLNRDVRPGFPGAWIDNARTRVGYEIALTNFFVPELAGAYDQLRSFANLITAKATFHGREVEGDAETRPYLKAQDLHTARSSLELANAPVDSPALTVCRGGDLVGRPGNWRLLPQSFGDAVTDMFVLRPLRGNGRTLCEWLNSRRDNPPFVNPRDLLNTQVPIDLIDTEIDDLLEDVQEARRRIQEAAFGVLPNVFETTQTEIVSVRNEIRSTAYEARLVAELVRPLEDPIWRAEWTYPYHIAALARRYRISVHPAEQKDGLLKLGEAVARVAGILALAEITRDSGFTKPLQKQFRSGATFGTWLTIISKFAAETMTPKLSELSCLRPVNGVRGALGTIKDYRNDSHHSHGVRVSHELKAEIEKLEPHVISTITAVNWLSSTPWEWIERCEYLDESSYRIVGLRLRGSHPSWEPFERPSIYPLKPDRVYVDCIPGGTPVGLWPFVVVRLCPECRTRELFLLNQARDDSLILRSLEEHQLEISYTEPERNIEFSSQ